jgi:hypothetical protein
MHAYKTGLIDPLIRTIGACSEFTKGDLFTLASTLRALKNEAAQKNQVAELIQKKVLSPDLNFLDI